MPGVMEERKNVPFTLVKRKTDESLGKILCNLLKTQNIHGKDGKSACKPFLLCGMLILWKRLLPSETGRARAEHSRERMGLVAQTTKRALEASLKKLLVQKPLNKITINDITEDCGVNRMTLEGRKDIDDWDKAFLDVLLKIQENKLLVLNVYRSISQEQVEQYLYKIVDPLLHEFVDKETQDISIQDEDKQFVIDFFKYALVGMVLEWIRKDMKTDPVLLTQRLNKLLHGGIRRTLLKFQAGGGTVALPKD